MTALPVLVADDQLAVREAMRLLLKGERYEVLIADSAAGVLERLRTRDVGLVLMDLNYTRDTTSGQEGLNLLSQIQRWESPPPVVVMTAWATIDLAVEAMRRGAKDFIAKPWENARVLATVRTQLELQAAARKTLRLESELEAMKSQERVLAAPEAAAQSPPMRELLDIIQRVGPSDASVLITGENGSGKSLVAKMLHAASLRAGKALVTVNMGGISETLFESELFGHTKGAFTDAKGDRMGRFELADGGSLFLDEIGNLPLSQQAKLLRTIETGEFERLGSSKSRQASVRVISATNADLAGEVMAGRFRQDLFFRLNTVELKAPAFRDRGPDILPLARAFLTRHARQYRKNLTGFDPDAERSLLAHRWPGNVRELEHAIERAVLMASGINVTARDLALQPAPLSSKLSIEDMSLEEIERHLVKHALARFDGNARQAAEALGLSRATFYRRLQRCGL